MGTYRQHKLNYENLVTTKVFIWTPNLKRCTQVSDLNSYNLGVQWKGLYLWILLVLLFWVLHKFNSDNADSRRHTIGERVRLENTITPAKKLELSFFYFQHSVFLKLFCTKGVSNGNFPSEWLCLFKRLYKINTATRSQQTIRKVFSFNYIINTKATLKMIYFQVSLELLGWTYS